MKLITFAATFFAIAIRFSNSVQFMHKSSNDLVDDIREALVNLDIRISHLEQAGKIRGDDTWETDNSYEVEFLQNSEGISVNLPMEDTEEKIYDIEFDFKTSNKEGVLLHSKNWNIWKIFIDDGEVHFSLIEDKGSPDTVKKFISNNEWHTVHVALEPWGTILAVDGIQIIMDKSNDPRSAEAIMFGADLINSSDKFIGKMKKVKLNYSPVRLSHYFNSNPGRSPYPKPDATSVNLKAGEMISFKFSSNYSYNYMKHSDVISSRPKQFHDNIEIKFATRSRNKILYSLSAPDEQYFNVLLDLNGFLKLEFKWTSRNHEFVIGNKNLADGTPHSVEIEIKHLGPVITYKTDGFGQWGEVIFGPRKLDDGYGIKWSTLSLGNNGTGFAGCIIYFKIYGDDLLNWMANISIPSEKFDSLQTFPEDFKRITCSNHKPDFNIGNGIADDGLNRHHKHHDHHRHHHRDYEQRHGHHHQHGCHEVQPELKKSDDDYEKKYFDASCDVRPNTALAFENRRDVRGRVAINYEVSHQSDGASNATITVKVKLRGLLPPPDVLPSSFYTVGMHIHEFGNLSNGCESTGSHFNPFSTSHGSPHSNESHYGDLGNIVANSRGGVDTTLVIHRFGDILEPIPYIGRALVIHEHEDDLGLTVNSTGSKVHGNAGPRIACCIIYANKGHHP